MMIGDSISSSEISPLMTNVVKSKVSNNNRSNISNDDDNGNIDNAPKQRMSFSQLRPFLNIAIPYFRHNRSGSTINISIIIIITIIFLTSIMYIM